MNLWCRGTSLEYDRYYRNTAAFEFNGAQHRRPTQRYDKQKYTVTRTHDLIKSGLSTEKNIILIAVTKPDLTIEGMLKLIPKSLKTWPLVEGAYLTAVRETCDEYMKSETGESSA
jgi:hypothetical protein